MDSALLKFGALHKKQSFAKTKKAADPHLYLQRCKRLTWRIVRVWGKANSNSFKVSSDIHHELP
jgi:hypothetical protein